MFSQTSSSAIQGITLIAYKYIGIYNYPYNDFEFIYSHCLDIYIYRFTCALHSFFYKNVVFPAQAEYSYFAADFRLKIFLYYS